MLLQHPWQARSVAKCPHVATPTQGVSAELHRPEQQEPQAVRVDQGTGEAPAHHRGDQGISGGSPAQTQEAAPQGAQYKELTGRCTRRVPLPTFHVSISGSILALYGAVLSTITAAVSGHRPLP